MAKKIGVNFVLCKLSLYGRIFRFAWQKYMCWPCHNDDGNFFFIITEAITFEGVKQQFLQIHFMFLHVYTFTA